MKRKDALTDLVEFVQGKPSTPPPSGDRQVVNSQEEVITLGHPGSKNGPPGNRAVSLELDVSEFTKKVSARVHEKVAGMIEASKSEKPLIIKAKIKKS